MSNTRKREKIFVLRVSRAIQLEKEASTELYLTSGQVPRPSDTDVNQSKSIPQERDTQIQNLGNP